MKCPQCQAELESDAAFCTSCGTKIAMKSSVPPEISRPQPNPARPAPGGSGLLRRLLGFMLMSAALSMMTFAAYEFHRKSAGEPILPSTTAPVEVPASQAAEPTRPVSRPTVNPTPVAAQPLQAFAGTWVVEDSGERHQFVLEGSQIVIHVNDNSEIRLGFLGRPGHTLHGTYSDPHESYPATAELSADGQRLTLTLAPPASEYMSVTFVR